MSKRTLGEAVKLWREAAGLNQSQLARAIGVTPAYVNQLESGHRTGLTADALFALCRELRVTCDDFGPYFSQPAPTAPAPARAMGKFK